MSTATYFLVENYEKYQYLLAERNALSGAMSSIYPFMPSGFFYLNSLDRSISYIRGAGRCLVSFYYCHVL